MTNIIKSSHEVAHIKVVRAKSDDFSLVVLYSEDDTPVDLQDKDIRLFFFDPKREFVILSVPPSDINSNVATFTLTKQETIRLPNDTCKLSIKIGGRTRAHGTFSWAYDYADEPSDIRAIGINYRTLTEDTVWFDVLLGPTGKSAYQHAVDGGYTGTKEDFEQAMADLPHARDEAEAARDISVEAKNQAVSARDEAVLAADTSTEAKEDALLAQAAAESARDIAISAKNDAEDARDIAVNAKGDAEAAQLAAEDAQDIAESARDTAVGAANTAISAKEDAEDAKQDAETAKGLAESARDAAIMAKNDAESAKDTAVGAANTAVSAKENAEDASNAAIQAKGDAELAAQAAEEDRDEAEQFRDQAEGYRDESEQFRDEAYYFAYLTGLGSPLWYGVQWDVTVAATELTRIGNLDMHRELPIQNSRYGCTLLDNGVVNYKLDANDWSKKADGTSSTLDGSDGQVMVYQPEYWVRFEKEGNIRRAKFSQFQLPGYIRNAPYFRGAYEAALHRPTNKLGSVKNTSTEWRGGNNNAEWDEDDRTLLGMPASAISRTNFQEYARNRGDGWEMEAWFVYLSEWWLYLLEYSNRNSQEAFNSNLTVDGFKQGGLGAGVTNLNGSAWTSWKNQYGFVPCGYTDELGIYTGIKSLQLPAGYGSELSTSVPRWRGIENPFGHLWKWVNGINLLVQADGDGGKSYAYRQDDPSLWSTNVDNYRLIGEVARVEGYTTDVVFGESGDLLHAQTGGSSSTFWADRWYTLIPSSDAAIRGLLVGGRSDYGANAGFGCLISSYVPSNTYAFLGARLCFLPEHPLLTP